MKTASDRHSHLPDALRNEARAWLRQLASGNVTEWDLLAFNGWKHASPDHALAFDEAKRQWQALRPAIGKLLHNDHEAAAFHARSMRLPQPERRMFLRAACSFAVAGVAGVAIVHPPLRLWPSLGELQADARTGKGEQRSLALSDRVNLTLNTETSVRQEASMGETNGIDLIFGEAAIDLRAGSKPFSVIAGAGRSISKEGQFEVRNLDGRVCVTCIQGTVRVEHRGSTAELAPRQQIAYDTEAVGRAVAVETESVSAWRKGELVFRQTPLGKVIDEINRYRPGRVVLTASSVRDSAVSGRFALGALDHALLQLQRSFDLTARRLPGGVLVLS